MILSVRVCSIAVATQSVELVCKDVKIMADVVG